MSFEEHDYLAAEARARKKIDEKLVEAGGKVQDRAKANLYADQGVALREFVHGEGHGRSDYALYVDRQLVGVLEAKPEGQTLTEVELQSRNMSMDFPSRHRSGLAAAVPLRIHRHRVSVHQLAGPVARSRRVFDGFFHRPETLAWLARNSCNPRGNIQSRHHDARDQ